MSNLNGRRITIPGLPIPMTVNIWAPDSGYFYIDHFESDLACRMGLISGILFASPRALCAGAARCLAEAYRPDGVP